MENVKRSMKVLMANETKLMERNEIRKTRSILILENHLPSDNDAPENGWGWIIALGMVVIYITSMGPYVCYALIFSKILNESSGASSALTTINFIELVANSISGLFANVMLKRCTVRQVGLVGAAIHVIPKCILPFVQHTYQLMIIALFSGLGFGIMNTVCNTNLNSYFIKKRSMVMCVIHTLICIGLVVYPKLVEAMLKEFGFLGTAAIMAGLGLHCIPAMLIVHPVEWHKRRPNEILKQKAFVEMKEISKDDPNESSNDDQTRRHSTGFINAKERVYSLRSLKEEEYATPLITKILESNVKSGTIYTRMDRDSSISELYGQASILSIASLTKAETFDDSRFPVKVTTDKPNEKKPSESFLVKLKNSSEISLLKSWTFLNTCFGTSCTIITDMTFSSLLPMIMTDSGYSTSDITLTLTIGIIAEFVAKITLILLTMFVAIRPRYLFFGSMTIMVFARLGFLYCSHSLLGILVTMAMIGSLRSCFFILQFVVIIEDFPVDKIIAIYGVYSIIGGIVAIICGPFVGLVTDWTKSFVFCQIALIGLNALFVVPWLLEFILIGASKRR